MFKKITVITVILFVLICAFAIVGAGCSKSSSDILKFTSSLDSGHTHDVNINNSDINTPPTSSKSITTTSNGGHTHSITLSQNDYQSLKSGNTVNMTTSSVQNHTHTFAFKK